MATKADIHLSVQAHADELAGYVFGYRSRSRGFKVIASADNPYANNNFIEPDDTGLVTFKQVLVDPQGDFIVVALNTQTLAKLIGSAPYSRRISIGYLFEVAARGPDRTTTVSSQTTQTVNGASNTSTGSGTVGVTGGVPWLSGNASTSASRSTTGPSVNNATQQTSTQTTTTKDVRGITVTGSIYIKQVSGITPVTGVRYG